MAFHPRALAHISFLLSWSLASSTTVLLLNHWSHPVEMMEPRKASIQTGSQWRGDLKDNEELVLSVLPDKPMLSATLPGGRYAIVVINSTGGLDVLDTNDFQIELSRAGRKCASTEAGSVEWKKCLAKQTFGGVERSFAAAAFEQLWLSHSFWKLCAEDVESPTLRSFVAETGHTVEIFRESPKVAAVRGFVNETMCKGLMSKLGKKNLVRAHVGGKGSTSTSDSRETLTSNMFVDWGADDVLTHTSALTFDLASELLGAQIPYEGQEPVNFLHYLRGFEYKPHSDGSGERLGKRVVTTLMYCETADEGGATVFPLEEKSLKFVPRPGDLLYFQYAPDPSLALHAACPVFEGTKSTLTQWHRLGVSPEQPWDNFEEWGKFHNPHGETRWVGPRYSRVFGSPGQPLSSSFSTKFEL